MSEEMAKPLCRHCGKEIEAEQPGKGYISSGAVVAKGQRKLSPTMRLEGFLDIHVHSARSDMLGCVCVSVTNEHGGWRERFPPKSKPVVPEVFNGQSEVQFCNRTCLADWLEAVADCMEKTDMHAAWELDR